MSHLPRGALDSAYNPLVRAATADVGAHVLDDLGSRRLWLLLEQVGRAHDLAGLAVATLWHALGKPGLLHWMARIRRQTFDRSHRLADDISDLRLTRKCTLAINVHHAGATQ